MISETKHKTFNKSKIDHFGHILISSNELDKIIKPYDLIDIAYKTSWDFGNFYGVADGFKLIEYRSWEIISDQKYWFRVQRPSHEIENSDIKYHFSIYGLNISCLALFQMYTGLTPLSNQEYIEKHYKEL